ncbi:MAG TPA: copper amine oxidase N-terminal domain-containing protein [Syntrophomonadaceae bacterium]|nr:copper amine oxidase N-terminal domain-containing protein [Syntrophomonadaceae bacterium]
MGKRSGKIYKKKSARAIVLIWALALLLMFMPVAPAAAVEISGNQNTTMVFIIDNNSYTVNGELIVMDVSPVVVEGRTMLPIRYAATPLGADIGWSDIEKKVTVSLGSTKIELWIGQSNALIDGKTISIDPENPNVMPLIINGRTMLPIRFVTENLGCDVQWDPVTKKVTITKTGTSTPSISIKPGLQIIKPSVEIKQPGIIISGTAQSEEQADFQFNDSLTANDLQALFAPPPDFQKIAPSMVPGEEWGSQPKGKPFKIDSTEKDIPIVMRVGRGYNVFGKYADVNSLKQSVLDVEKLIQDGKMEGIRIDKADEEHIVAESIREYSSQMSSALGGSGRFLCFGGSVQANFDSSRTEKLENYFSTYYWIVKKYGVYIDGTTNLKNYLLPNAKQMINDKNVPAQTVFATFGHYVLVDAITGGRIDYSITASSKSSTSFENFKVATKADFNALIVKASASGSYQNVQNRSEYEGSRLDHFSSSGGAFMLEKGLLENDPSLLSKWEATLNDDGNLVEFGTTTTRPLVPIWELCSDPSRAAYLKAEFEKMNEAMAEQNKWPAEKYVVDVGFVYGPDEWSTRAACPPGYQLYNADLNAGAGGSYIYLCYKLGENADDAITDLFMERTGGSVPATTATVNHNANNVPYTRLGVDLNINAGGDFIYMWYTKAKTRPPVKDMGVAFGNVGWPDYDTVCWQNTQEPADVNRGAGGEYIYIKFKR